MKLKDITKRFSNPTPKVMMVLLILAVLAAYAPSLPNQFIWDDHDRIEKNQHLDDLSNIPELFNIKGYYEISMEPSFRPVVIISRFIDTAIWGKWPPGHRLTNLLLHLAVSLLFFYFCLKFLQNTLYAGLAALLFAVHPVLSEAVAGISFRADILLGLFGLLALLSFWRFRLGKQSVLMLPASITASLLAMLSKETAVAVPVIILLFDLLYVKQNPLPADKGTRKFDIHAYWGFLAILIYYGWLRFGAFLHPNEAYLGVKSFAGPLYIVATSARIFMLTIIKFGWPLNLTNWEVFQRSTQIGLSEILGFAVFLSFVAALIFFYSRNRRISFGLAWYLLALLPVIQLLPTADPFFERWMYLPSMGIIIAVIAVILAVIKKEPQKRRLISSLLVLIVLVFMTRTAVRCLDWQNDYTLWKSAAIAQPENVDALIRIGDYPKAIRLMKVVQQKEAENFEINQKLSVANFLLKNYPPALDYAELASKSLQNKETAARQPRSVRAIFYNHLADLYLKEGRYSEAASVSQQSISLFYIPAARIKLGRAYAGMGHYGEAFSEFRRARKDAPYLEEAYIQEGLTYRKMDDLQSALKVLLEAHEKFPEDVIIIAELADALKASGDLATARSLAGEPLQIDVDELLAWSRKQPAPTSLQPTSKQREVLEQAREFKTKGKPERAIRLLEELKLKSKWDKIYLELGTAYAMNRQFDKAAENWLIGIRLNPRNADFYYNLGMYSALARDYTNAYKFWSHSLELNPNQPDLRTSIAALPD